MTFLVAKCVWGAYVRTMLEVNLPSLLAPGNLPALVESGRVEHAVFTTSADAPVIEAHPTYRRMASILPCRIEVLADPPAGADYLANLDRMNQAHRRILGDCARTGSTWLFDQPDHVWGNGSLSYLVRRADAGVRCVMFAGIRTVQETLVPALDAWRDGPTLAIPHRDLIGLATAHFHAHDMGRFWGTEVASFWPHHTSWRVGPRSFLRRSFHVQPFLIAQPATGVLPSRSVDDDFVDRAYPDPADVEFVRDTDDFAVIEVSPRLHVLDHGEGRLSIPQVAAWAAETLNERKSANFRHPIRFRGDATGERRWRRVGTLAASVSDTVERMAIFHKVHAAVGPERLGLATLLGRLLRDRAAHRAMRVPPGPLTLLVPDEETIGQRIDDDIPALCAWVGRHVLAGDRPMDDLVATGWAESLDGCRHGVGGAAGAPTVGRGRVAVPDDRLGPVRVHWLDGALA